MEMRSMEITVKSASNLKRPNLLCKTKAYAVVFVQGGGKRSSRSEHRTNVDKENGRNPSWNEAMSFTLHEASLQQDRLFLTVQIWSATVWGPHPIGHVTVPLRDFLLKQNDMLSSYKCQLVTPSGKPKGILNLSVKISEKTKIQ
ncbi:hypothetical protein KI387_000610, partial [Taxus chinensis]